MGDTRCYSQRYSRYIGKVFDKDCKGNKLVYLGKTPKGYNFRLTKDDSTITVNYQTFREYLHRRKILEIIERR